VGEDLKAMGVTNVLVVTDKNVSFLPLLLSLSPPFFFSPFPLFLFLFEKLSKLKPVQTVLESLNDAKLKFHLYEDTRVEPTDERFVFVHELLVKSAFDRNLGNPQHHFQASFMRLGLPNQGTLMDLWQLEVAQ